MNQQLMMMIQQQQQNLLRLQNQLQIPNLMRPDTTNQNLTNNYQIGQLTLTEREHNENEKH